jgi:hypothetical protein
MMKSSSGAGILRSLAVAMLSALAVSSGACAGSDEEAIARIEHDFAAMQITKDPATIESVAAVMDEGFRFTDPAGRDAGASRAELLGLLKSDKLVVDAMDFRPFTIRIFGSTAIVEGVNTGHASFAGKDVSGTFAWVDVFEKREGRWIWLFSQSGKVGDPLSDKDPCSRPPCPAVHPGFSVNR